jgi:hypothetical protein
MGRTLTRTAPLLKLMLAAALSLSLSLSLSLYDIESEVVEWVSR